MVYDVTTRTFEGFVKSREGVLIRVTYGTDTDFPSAIEDYFDSEYHGVIACGTMRWEDMTLEAWREKHFRGYAGREVVRGGTAGQPGFWLFIKGDPWHYESEVDLANFISAAAFHLQLKGQASRFSPTRLPSWENAVIAGIEKYLRSSMIAVSIAVAVKMAPKPQPQPRTQAPPRPPPGAAAPPPPKKEDPYVVLGVSRGATRETVDRVFRIRSKGCHPDGYHGLPEDVRAIAEADFKRLTNARDTIYVERGWMEHAPPS